MQLAQRLILIAVGVAFAFSSCIAGTATARKPASASVAQRSWQPLARKVGQSEEFREASIREIKRVPHLQAQLYRALSTSDRLLALEVIGALNMRSLLPDLLSRASRDSDGFTVLAVNSLLTPTNSNQILRLWSSELTHFESLSVPIAVAMLEPMARMNLKLARPLLQRLATAPSPELRSSLLSYLRVMALRNGVVENLDLVSELTHASEVQVRLQAISISAEVTTQPRGFRLSSLKSLDELNALCLKEAGSTLKEACLSFLAVGVAAKQ